jgi:hypothetical protein
MFKKETRYLHRRKRQDFHLRSTEPRISWFFPSTSSLSLSFESLKRDEDEDERVLRGKENIDIARTLLFWQIERNSMQDGIEL